jgi:hypothetical protein
MADRDPLATSSAVPRAETGDRPRFATVVLRGSAIEAGLVTTRCPQCGVNPAGLMQEYLWRFLPPWVFAMLCTDCAETTNKGRVLRVWSFWIMAIAPILFGVGAMLLKGRVVVGVTSGAVIGIVAMIAMHRYTRFDLIYLKRIDKAADTITLLVPPSAAKIFREETDAVVPGNEDDHD